MSKVVPIKRNDAAEIGDLYEASTKSLVEAVLSRLECGRRLSLKKKELGHGEWLPWLKANHDVLGFGENAAQRMMKASANTAPAQHLTDEEALALSRQMWAHTPKQIKKPAPLDEAERNRLAGEWHYRDTDEPPEEDSEDDAEAERLRRIRAHMERAQDAIDYALDDILDGVELTAGERSKVLGIARKAADACRGYLARLEDRYAD